MTVSTKMRICFSAAAFCLFLLSWTRTGEPSTIFSLNGIGDAVRRVDVRSKGMGGAGRAMLDGQSFNSSNPALLAAVRRAGFTGRFFMQRRALKDADGVTHVVSDGDIGGLSVTLPIRQGSVFGLSWEPLTDVDFGLVVDAFGEEPYQYRLTVDARGGIEALSAAFGQRAGKRLYFGFRIDAVTGTITETWIKDFEDASIHFSKDRIVRSHRGVLWALGLAFSPVKRWALGLSFQPSGSIEQTRTLRNVYSDDRGDVYVDQEASRFVGSALFDVEDRSEVDLKMPAILGGGISYSSGYKWLVGVDIEKSYWSNTGNDRRDAFELSAGLLYRTGSKDLVVRDTRVEWMGGVHRRSLYFKTKGSAISEIGASLGLGVPLKNRGGMFRYVVEFGSRGDERKHGASEWFIGQRLSFSGWLR